MNAFIEKIRGALTLSGEEIIATYRDELDGMACLVTQLSTVTRSRGEFCVRLYDTDAEALVAATWFKDAAAAVAYAKGCCDASAILFFS